MKRMGIAIAIASILFTALVAPVVAGTKVAAAGSVLSKAPEGQFAWSTATKTSMSTSNATQSTKTTNSSQTS